MCGGGGGGGELDFDIGTCVPPGFFFQTHPIHLYQFSEMYTYWCISYINFLPINAILYALVIFQDYKCIEMSNLATY